MPFFFILPGVCKFFTGFMHRTNLIEFTCLKELESTFRNKCQGDENCL